MEINQTVTQAYSSVQTSTTPPAGGIERPERLETKTPQSTPDAVEVNISKDAQEAARKRAEELQNEINATDPNKEQVERQKREAAQTPRRDTVTTAMDSELYTVVAAL